MIRRSPCFIFFFFNDTATTEIYTLSLHDALPISASLRAGRRDRTGRDRFDGRWLRTPDRKSTRLNSSHTVISYAVFCLKKKKKKIKTRLSLTYASDARYTAYRLHTATDMSVVDTS